MAKWCSFVHYIPGFGDWFEGRYGNACEIHDNQRAHETARRAAGLPPEWYPGFSDLNLLINMSKRGPLDFLVAIPSTAAAWAFYWPNRWRKYLTGRVDNV